MKVATATSVGDGVAGGSGSTFGSKYMDSTVRYPWRI